MRTHDVLGNRGERQRGETMKTEEKTSLRGRGDRMTDLVANATRLSIRRSICADG